MMVAFVVPGEPVAKGRARAFVRGGYVGHYTPEKTAIHENLVRLCAQQAMTGAPMTGPVALYCTFVMPIPESTSKKRAKACLSGEIWPCKRPDTDNLLKAVLDGCNGVVWKDDCQVVQLFATKVYGTPMTTVKVGPAVAMLELPVRAPIGTEDTACDVE